MFSVSCCSRSSLGHAKPAEEMGALSAGDGGLWSSYCAVLAWICKRAEFIGWVGFALLPGDSSGWVTRCFNRDFQKKSMPPPWRGRNSPSAPLPSARRVRRWAHLVFGDEGFDLINILWHGLLVPLDQGCLSPLDPSQELFQKLCIRHQLGKRRLQSLLVLLRPRENLLETQGRLSAQHRESRGRNRHHAAVLGGVSATASRRQPGTKPGGLTSSNLARMMVIQCLIVVMQSGWQAARMTSPMPTAAFTSTLFSSTFFMNS